MNGHIVDIEREIGVHYLRMGEVFYEGYRTGDMSIAEEEMTELCKACDLLNEEIEEIRNRIAILKNERVCECGTVVALDANFCPNCGRKLEKLPVPQNRSESDQVAYDQDEEPSSFVSNARQNDQEEELDLEGLTVGEAESRRSERLREEHERQEELDRLVRSWKQDLGIPHEEEPEELDTVQKTSTTQSVPPAVGTIHTPPAAKADAGDVGIITDEPEAPEEIDVDTFNCQVCGQALPKGSKWCPNCGTEQV